MLKKTLLISISALWLVACGDKTAPTNQTPISKQSLSDLPEDAPAIGTNISEIKKAVTESNNAPALQDNEQDAAKTEGADAEYPELSWDELSPEGYEQGKILDKYQPLIDSIPEGSPEENKVFDKMMAELNTAPANEKLDGKKVKIPGFVSPLDESDGKVTEFLLVPYFGACIHVPPPPLNNTLLIKPQPEYAIPFDKTYEPVWVLGSMQVKTTSTDLAQAGYLIEEAIIEEYDVDAEAAKAEAKEQEEDDVQMPPEAE
jgi:hypothetical protein